MYKNSGAKVKGLATFFAVLGMIGSVIMAVVIMASNETEEGIILGVVVALVGCLFAWLSGLLLAAFGELVQNTYEILQLLKGMKSGKAGPLTPAEAGTKVTAEEIDNVMKRNNAPYVEAVIQAKKEKSATVASAPVKEVSAEKTAPAEKVCSRCATRNKPDSVFCFNCGSKL